MSSPYENKNSLIRYSESIKKISDFSRQKNLNLKFVLLPFKMQTIKNCEEKYLQPQIQTSKILKEFDLIFYDFTEDFCNNKDNANLYLNFDPVHLSKAGHELVSTLLLEKNIFN